MQRHIRLASIVQEPRQPVRQVIVHIDKLETLVQVRKHDRVHDFDVGVDDFVLAAFQPDVNQVYSRIDGRLFENGEKGTSLFGSDVDCEVGRALFDQPLGLLTEIMNRLELFFIRELW